MSPISERRKRKVTEITLWVTVVTFIIVLIFIGVTMLTEEKRIQVGSTLQTTAIVVDKEIHTLQNYTDYEVHLGFSKSPMAAEVRELLIRQEQGIRLSSRDKFDHFYLGKEVTMVYHVVDYGRSRVKVAIESVDGYQPEFCYGDLTIPGQEKGQTTAIMWMMGGGLAVFVVLLFLFYH